MPNYCTVVSSVILGIVCYGTYVIIWEDNDLFTVSVLGDDEIVYSL